MHFLFGTFGFLFIACHKIYFGKKETLNSQFRHYFKEVMITYHELSMPSVSKSAESKVIKHQLNCTVSTYITVSENLPFASHFAEKIGKIAPQTIFSEFLQ